MVIELAKIESKMQIFESRLIMLAQASLPHLQQNLQSEFGKTVALSSFDFATSFFIFTSVSSLVVFSYTIYLP